VIEHSFNNLNMELALPSGDGAQPAFARVTKQLRGANGLLIGTAHDNPILDSWMYEVEYQDGHKLAMAANVIAQNLFAQVDAEGNCHVLFDEIIDHRTDGKEVKQQDGKRLPSKCDTLMKLAYQPELDNMAELKAEGVQYYQELIGVLRWATELGRVDILYEVATMLTHLAMPRIGHLEELLHIFGYLKQRPKRKLAFDPDHPMIGER
jgi:hypothetical protein